MINSIGVDIVQISGMRRLIMQSDGVFVRHTFTEEEMRQSETSEDPAEYFSARLASKEAVFKAIAHYTSEKTFDPRIIETLTENDGSPLVTINEELGKLMDEAGIAKLHVSLSHDGDYVIAFVIAEKQ